MKFKHLFIFFLILITGKVSAQISFICAPKIGVAFVLDGSAVFKYEDSACKIENEHDILLKLGTNFAIIDLDSINVTTKSRRNKLPNKVLCRKTVLGDNNIKIESILVFNPQYRIIDLRTSNKYCYQIEIYNRNIFRRKPKIILR